MDWIVTNYLKLLFIVIPILSFGQDIPKNQQQQSLYIKFLFIIQFCKNRQG